MEKIDIILGIHLIKRCRQTYLKLKRILKKIKISKFEAYKNPLLAEQFLYRINCLNDSLSLCSELDSGTFDNTYTQDISHNLRDQSGIHKLTNKNIKKHFFRSRRILRDMQDNFLSYRYFYYSKKVKYPRPINLNDVSNYCFKLMKQALFTKMNMKVNIKTYAKNSR